MHSQNADKGASDLSHRAVMYQMPGLSFREYLQLFHYVSINTYSLSDILQHKVELPKDFHSLVYFTNYLKSGYYPFALEDDFDVQLQQTINHTWESEIAAMLGTSRNNIADYCL